MLLVSRAPLLNLNLLNPLQLLIPGLGLMVGLRAFHGHCRGTGMCLTRLEKCFHMLSLSCDHQTMNLTLTYLTCPVATVQLSGGSSYATELTQTDVQTSSLRFGGVTPHCRVGGGAIGTQLVILTEHLQTAQRLWDGHPSRRMPLRFLPQP